MNARLFIQFIAEIYMREIRRCLKDSPYEKLTRKQIFNHIKAIIKIKFKGKYKEIFHTLTKTQEEIVELIKNGCQSIK
jgi:hypothetical protein